MSIKSDRWIKEMCNTYKMIEPFSENLIRKNKISYGLSSYGYDLRISEDFKIPNYEKTKLIDPKKSEKIIFEDFYGKTVIIPPNSFILGKSMEYFRIPREVIALCFGKSTYARCGIIVNITPLEPEWEGFITISIVNSSPIPVKIYAKEGIAQVIFIESDEKCIISYKDRKGKYQSQKKITISKI